MPGFSVLFGTPVVQENKQTIQRERCYYRANDGHCSIGLGHEMYVFQPMSHHPGLKHYQNYPDYHDIGRRIVFVKDGAVVFREDEVAVSTPYTVCLMFEYSGHFYFTPETAVFRAVKVTERTSGKHIELYLQK